MTAIARPTVFRATPDLIVVLALGLAALAGCGSSTTLPAGGRDGAADALSIDAPLANDAPITDGPAAPPDGSDAAGSDALPNQCQVVTDRAPPFQVTFRLANRGARTVYVHQSCTDITFDVASCASGYTDSLVSHILCPCYCSDPSCTGGGIACAPCAPDLSLAIDPGQTKDANWMAQTIASVDRGGYSCEQRTPLPASRYSLSVSVYDSPADAVSGRHPRAVHQLFSLPAAGDVVEVALPPAPSDGGTSDGPTCDPGGPAPVCAPPFSAGVACALDTSYTFGFVGGLVFRTDESALAPPNHYTRTRTVRSQPPPLTCSNDLSRCGASNDTFTTADVMQALAAPDVVAALAQPQPLVFGFDGRASDGQVFAITRADGHGLVVGGSCDAGRTCARPATDGMNKLVTILQKIDQQQLALPGCEALRP